MRQISGTSDGWSIANAICYAIFTYTGWVGGNNVIEEVKNPEKTVPLAAMISIAMVTTLYLMVNITYIAILGVPGVRSFTVSQSCHIPVLKCKEHPSLHYNNIVI